MPKLPKRPELFACILLLSGCAAAPRPQPVVVFSVSQAELLRGEVLDYGASLGRLDATQLDGERKRLDTLPATAVNSLELALVLGRGNAAADLDRAAGLAQAVAQGGSPEARALQDIARMLHDDYAQRGDRERERQAELDHTVQQLRDAQRRGDQLAARLDDTTQKLNALKAIETSLPAPGALGMAASGRSTP